MKAVTIRIALCLVAGTLSGCTRSGSVPGTAGAPGNLATDTGSPVGVAYVEPIEKGADGATLMARRQPSPMSGDTAWAYRVHGGPVLVHTALFCDYARPSFGERRTVCYSQTLWTEPSSVEPGAGDGGGSPRYTFSRFPVDIVVDGSGPLPRVVVKRPWERRLRDGRSAGDGRDEIRTFVPASPEAVLAGRSFPVAAVAAGDGTPTAFHQVRGRGISRGVLQQRQDLKVGEAVTLYEEWPVRNWGPDDLPLVFSVAVLRLDLPATFDERSLRETIERLRNEVRERPDDSTRKLQLTVGLEALTLLESVERDEVSRTREEAVGLMRQAVTERPWNSILRDRLRRELINLGYALSDSDDYARISELIEEMLRLEPGFEDFDEASLLALRCAGAVRHDPSIAEPEKGAVQRRYRDLAVDYLRRGLEADLDRGGIELLDYRRDWLSSLGRADSLTPLSTLDEEFESNPAFIERNIQRWSRSIEDGSRDAGALFRLAAAHDMLSRVLQASNEPDDRAACDRHARQAVDTLRQAIQLAQEDRTVGRRLRRQLLRYAERVAWQSDAPETTPELIREALRYDPEFRDYVAGAAAIARAVFRLDGVGGSPSKVDPSVIQTLRVRYAETWRAGLDWVRRNRPQDVPWIRGQLPIAVAEAAHDWPEIAEFLKEAEAVGEERHEAQIKELALP